MAMPYIEQNQRKDLDWAIEDLARAITSKTQQSDNLVIESAGKLNYSITRLCCLVAGKPAYGKIAAITGVLENVKQEFYRRYASPYEDLKIAQNGDTEEYKNLQD